MADVGYIAIVVAGFGAYWWRHLRAARPRQLAPSRFTADAEVALHVAVHEAESRDQVLSSVHVLYGMLQDEAVTAAIATAGGNADALEDRVLAALAVPVDNARDDTQLMVGRAALVAQRAGRQASCTDLWAFLGDSHAARILDAAKLDRGAILFALFHGGTAPELTDDDRDVFVVLRNDHYTTQEFVCGVLREVFELHPDAAEAIMLRAHTDGRGVIGRFTADTARNKIRDARSRAAAHAFPLWIGTEPA